ncbi:MAG: alpha/beta hydrolase [Propionibacteriaceae bacterium]|jgi:pimeloyl-ACP methyl ester carboxylesterase|nr:alpha/beta hydrolase [Propionibacteriaceae bacterium]
MGDKVIVFLHGANVDHRMWDPQVDTIADEFNLVVWDARGHGQSALSSGQKFTFADLIPDLLKLYEVCGITKATLIGQSMGGNLAQEMAYYHPDLVESLVLIGCTKNTGSLTRMEKILLSVAKPLLYCHPWKTLVKQSAEACANRNDVRRYVTDCFTSMDKETFIEAIMSVTTCLHEDAAYRFPCPALLLCGSDDTTGNIRKIAQPWAESDPNCTFHMIENAGHNANQDAPEIVNPLIQQFLGVPPLP